jgi:hypothetical protein
MPRRDRVNPIRPGGGLPPVESLDLMRHDGPEPDSSQVRPEVDWRALFESGAFTGDELQFLLFSRLLGKSKSATRSRLGWSRAHLASVQATAIPRFEVFLVLLRRIFDQDFSGGNSRSLSFKRAAPGGEVWNLTKLGQPFAEVMGEERKALIRKDVS